MDKLLSKDQYHTLIETWRKASSHTAGEHIIYNMLRTKAPDLGFSAIKSPSKINANGDDPWYGYNQARYHAFWLTKHPDRFKALTGLELTPELTDMIKQLPMKRS